MTSAPSHPIARTNPDEILRDSKELDTFIHHQLSAEKEKQRELSDPDGLFDL